MKKNIQVIDLAASTNEKVRDKTISHLKSKAVHMKRVNLDKYPETKLIPTGEVTNVTIPKSIRRKMQKSSSTVIPNRFVTIEHDNSELLVVGKDKGNKPKPLNKGEYKIQRVNTPKQLRQQQKKG